MLNLSFLDFPNEPSPKVRVMSVYPEGGGRPSSIGLLPIDESGMAIGEPTYLQGMWITFEDALALALQAAQAFVDQADVCRD